MSKCLRSFFERNPANRIQFWDCLSNNKWHLHHRVDKQAKSLCIPIRHPNKKSWEFCQKSGCNNLIKIWQMFFENCPYKSNSFLGTYDSDWQLILPTYAKWLSFFGQSNSICAQATHAPIGEYRSHFFPNESNTCSCNRMQLETRHHTLCQCPLYTSFSLVGCILFEVVKFPIINPRASCFLDSAE